MKVVSFNTPFCKSIFTDLISTEKILFKKKGYLLFLSIIFMYEKKLWKKIRWDYLLTYLFFLNAEIVNTYCFKNFLTFTLKNTGNYSKYIYYKQFTYKSFKRVGFKPQKLSLNFILRTVWKSVKRLDCCHNKL